MFMPGSLWWFDETYGNFVRKMFPSALKKKKKTQDHKGNQFYRNPAFKITSDM